jgi:hypothetical protein
MGFPWMLALKVIPWGDVIEHAPKVLKSARKLLDKQDDGELDVPLTPPREGGDAARLAALEADQARLQADLKQLAETSTALAEQNARLIAAVDVLRWRTRWLAGIAAVLLIGFILLWVGR